MMLTPVAAASSARDQSCDSRNARMAAPADSRLTAGSGHRPDITQPWCSRYVYTVLSRFSCARDRVVYTLLPTFHPDKEADMGHPCVTDPELWFGYPDDDSG